MKPIRILLVDDHSIVRQGIVSILEPDPLFEIVGQASTGADALSLVRDAEPDAVLLDIKLPDMGGVELCRQIMELKPGTAVLILTAYIDQKLVNGCLRAGARGYLLKDAENLRLRENLLSVMEGHAALDPRAAGVLTDSIRKHDSQVNAISQREYEILTLIAQGKTNKEIGSALSISENTVKGYVKEILAKLSARNRIEAILHAQERAIL